MKTNALIEKLAALQTLALEVKAEADAILADKTTPLHSWEFVNKNLGKHSTLAQITKTYGGESITHMIEMLSLLAKKEN